MFGRNKKKTESITQLPQMTQAITPRDEDFEVPVQKAEQKWDDDVDEFDSVEDLEELPEAPKPRTPPQTRREPERPVQKVQENKLEQEIITWIHATDKRIETIERVIDQFADDINQRIANVESKMFRLKGVL